MDLLFTATFRGSGGGGGGGKRESKKVRSRESMREIIHSFALLSKKWKVTGVRGTKTGEHVSKAKGSPLPASIPSSELMSLAVKTT